ncbi:MAG: hypothetical protein WCJ17_01435 [bacterium]
MIPLLLLCLCLIDPITATSTVKELSAPEQHDDSLNALDDAAMEEFSHLISIIGSKGPRSEKRLTRLSLTRLNFNTLYTDGSPELKESLSTFTQNLTRALATTAWSTHTKEVRVNALLRMAFTDLEALAKNNAQRELVLTLQKNLQLGLAPALTGLRETLRKQLPLKTLLALVIIAAGGFAAYKAGLWKKLVKKTLAPIKAEFQGPLDLATNLAPKVAALNTDAVNSAMAQVPNMLAFAEQAHPLLERYADLTERALPLAQDYRLLINRALPLAEQYREIANRGVAILEDPVVINFIDSIGTITKTNLAQTFTWLKTNGFIREGGTTPGDLAENVRNRFDQATRTMTFYRVDEYGAEIAGSAQNMPKNIVDHLTTIITQLTADGSASAELIKAITQQIKNGLTTNQAFLQHFGLWDEETNKIKTTITNAGSPYPVEFNQDNGRPYYRVALAAFSPIEQAKFRTNAAGGSVAIPTPAQQTTGTPGVGAGAGAGAGSGSTAVAEIRPMTTEVIIESTNGVEYVKIYAPLNPVERLFLVLDRAKIEKTSDLLITLRPEIYEIILGLKIGKIDPLSQTFRASLNAKLLSAQAAAERIMRERR